MSAPPPPPKPVERRTLHPGNAPARVSDTVYECSRRVTLCGPTGQLQVMAAIVNFMQTKKAWTWSGAGGNQHRVVNANLFHHFSGLPALAVLKSAGAADYGADTEHPARPSSDIREAFWYLLTFETEEIPVLMTILDVPEAFGRVLMDDLIKAVSDWRGENRHSEHIICLPRVTPESPSEARNVYWHDPWVSHHVHIRALPTSATAQRLLQETEPFDCAVKIPHLGRRVLGLREDASEADVSLGRLETYGIPKLLRFTVDSLANHVASAAIHLDQALRGEGSAAGPGVSLEVLRIVLVRDLIKTFSHLPDANNYTLQNLFLSIRWMLKDKEQRQLLVERLSHAMSDAEMRGRLAGALAAKCCSGQAPALTLPGVKTEAVQTAIIRECFEAFDWFKEQLPAFLFSH